MNKKTKKTEFGFKLGEEKELKYVSFDLDIDIKTEKLLVDYAKKNIMEDRNAILSWAITDILQKQIKAEEKKND